MHGVQIETNKQAPCGSLLSFLEMIPASNYEVLTMRPVWDECFESAPSSQRSSLER